MVNGDAEVVQIMDSLEFLLNHNDPVRGINALGKVLPHLKSDEAKRILELVSKYAPVVRCAWHPQYKGNEAVLIGNCSFELTKGSTTDYINGDGICESCRERVRTEEGV